MLALHLIQNCMVYINTLMIQKVLAQPHWHGTLTPRDYAALTPLIWEHVNPAGAARCNPLPGDARGLTSGVFLRLPYRTIGIISWW